MAYSMMDGGSGSAKKKMKPGVAARNTAREKFVSEKKASKGITTDQARQRFFVQTRMSEMKAKGKTVTPEMRKQLQKKFQSGNVSRKGFAAPAKKTGGSGSSSSSSVVTTKVTSKVSPRTDSSGSSGFGKTGKMMNSNKGSSAQAGMSAIKKKLPMRGSKY